MKEAYITLVATDAYAAGALVLSHKLRELGSKKEMLCLVTPNITAKTRDILSTVYTLVAVNTLKSFNIENLQLLGRPELDITLTKIYLWSLIDYNKLVFLDADTYPIREIDDLFNWPSFSAAPDAGWPDCFNSGVFVTEPSETVFNELMNLATTKGSFDGGDQGLLNSYFSSWSTMPSHRLPFTFNTTPTAQYSYAPAHNEYSQNISIVHFIGKNKPWKYQRFSDGKILSMDNSFEGSNQLIQTWWDTWDKYYGRTSPYHLLLSESNQMNDGFQTRPIVQFDETIENAWSDIIVCEHPYQKIEPMPPIHSISISQPDWLKVEEKRNQIEEKYQPLSLNESKQASDLTLGASIPDLSDYTNIWDQPHYQQRQQWIAPIHQPKPEIMKKPEYSQFKTDDYNPDKCENQIFDTHLKQMEKLNQVEDQSETKVALTDIFLEPQELKESNLNLLTMDNITSQNGFEYYLGSWFYDDDDNDTSDRDLIPINFKQTSKISGMYSPSSSNSRSNSRRPSVSSSRRDSFIRQEKMPALDMIMSLTPTPDNVKNLSHSNILYADPVSSYQQKIPYTSAEVTPDLDNLSCSETYEVYSDIEPTTSTSSDFLTHCSYSLSESLAEPNNWDPYDALNKLKAQTESMLIGQLLQEALEKAINEQQVEELQPCTIKKKTKFNFKSSWDDEEYDIPSGLISGCSSPSTPTMNYSGLSKVLELEKEKHRQHRASLLVSQSTILDIQQSHDLVALEDSKVQEHKDIIINDDDDFDLFYNETNKTSSTIESRSIDADLVNSFQPTSPEIDQHQKFDLYQGPDEQVKGLQIGNRNIRIIP